MKSIVISLFLIAAAFFLLTGCAEAPDEEAAPVGTPPPRITPRPNFDPPDFILPECRHFWRIPDCHTPRYCLDCGEVSAGPTPHEPTEPNFQEPSKCTLCGDILGDVLPPNFTESGLRINATAGRSYEFQTVTSLDPEMETVGSVSLLFIDMFETEPDYPRVPGYMYIRARFMMVFDDEAAVSYGYMYIIGHLDYFGMALNEQSVPFEYLSESNIPGFRTSNRTINFYGQEREYFLKYEEIMSTWVDGTAHVIREYTFLVPAGYDGIVVYLSSATLWSDHSRILSDNIDGNTLFFRLNTQTN